MVERAVVVLTVGGGRRRWWEKGGGRGGVEKERRENGWNLEGRTHDWYKSVIPLLVSSKRGWRKIVGMCKITLDEINKKNVTYEWYKSGLPHKDVHESILYVHRVIFDCLSDWLIEWIKLCSLTKKKV